LRFASYHISGIFLHSSLVFTCVIFQPSYDLRGLPPERYAAQQFAAQDDKAANAKGSRAVDAQPPDQETP
jgi:hypothetical protein